MDLLKNSSALKKIAAACGISGVLAFTILDPFEGKVNNVYLDPVFLATSCWGHTSPDLRLGQTFTDEQCLEQLEADLVKHDRQLRGVVTEKMNPYEHAAYLSFVYNVGIGAFSRSTMLGKLNAGNHTGACDELLKWVYAGKKKLKGLERRRAVERDMCLGKAQITDKEVLDAIAQSK
jgi:lysozyme